MTATPGGRTLVTCYYVRQRDAMALRADFETLFVDLDLHLMQLTQRLDDAQRGRLRDALACMTLHLASRPPDELSAWTINLRDPPLNLFVTGDSQQGTVVGRAFTEDVKVGPASLFFAQVSRPGLPIRQSAIEVGGAGGAAGAAQVDAARDVPDIVERFYAQSEQLPVRFFRLGPESLALVVAHTDCDRRWFDALDTEAVRGLDEREDLGPLSHRAYRFGCGCTLDVVLDLVLQLYRRDVDAALAGDDHLVVRCPRCAGVFRVTREMLERRARGESGERAARGP